MLVFSPKDFTENMKYYFELADKGGEILVQGEKKVDYKIVAIDKDDTLMMEEELLEEIDKDWADVDKESVHEKFRTDNLEDFLARVKEHVEDETNVIPDDPSMSKGEFLEMLDTLIEATKSEKPAESDND